MIHFMPFTFLGQSTIDRLYSVFGPVAVCQPLVELTSDIMRQAAGDGRLHFCPPDNVDQNRLRQSLRAFTSWAAAHQGRSGDLTGFFRSQQTHRPGRGAGQDEADAHQIHAQFRRRTDGGATESVDPLFEAALFLCLAHTYDQQQETLNLDLGKVHAMEENLGRILGEPDAAETTIGPSLSGETASDRGAYMTRRRLESWARVVLAHADDDSGFVTTSDAVMEDIQERCPAMEPVARIPVPTADDGIVHGSSLSADPIGSGFFSLARAEDPGAAAADLFNAPALTEHGALLTVYALQGCPPRDFLLKFIDKIQDDMNTAAQMSPPCHTIIGHFAC